MDYTSIHIYGHLLSDDILNNVEQDVNMLGNRDQDFGIDTTVSQAIDYAWSSLRNDWDFFLNRSAVNDPYGTKRVRALMERLFLNLGYDLNRQSRNIVIGQVSYNITYLAPKEQNMPVIVEGDRTGEETDGTKEKSTLDIRQKGTQRRKSPHATMLDYLNNTEAIYGIIANGRTLRLIRNSGQLVKLTYIEFDIQRMVEEDKYTEFCLFFRLLHASRFMASGDEPCIMERYFNQSIESGNRIRDGLSKAVESFMRTIARAALTGKGDGNDRLRQAIQDNKVSDQQFNKELIHLVYRLLFLFIIEDRGLVYLLPPTGSDDYKKVARWQDIYNRFYAASRFRHLSEKVALRNKGYHDLWESLMDTFRLFIPGGYGEPLGIKPLGGKLFSRKTLLWLQDCTIDNEAMLKAFSALNKFQDEKGNWVKINYSSLDVEEFGSVYEGILEMRPVILWQGKNPKDWDFKYAMGLDRKSTSSYYTRPDLVQNLIRTTLEPVITDKLKPCRTQAEQERMLLNLKVCDASSGSGHIALAMARTIAWHLAVVRTGEDNPASPEYRDALREVIQRCIYAVDMNPDAVELCKVVLWIEGYCAGKPLTFLDHHIRCGNSVVGVSNLQMLIDGVPDKALSAEDSVSLRKLKELNKEAVKSLNNEVDMNYGLPMNLDNPFGVTEMTAAQIGLGDKVRFINHMPEETLEQEEVKQQAWEELMKSQRVQCLRRACDIYTYAFYYTAKHDEVMRPRFEGSDEEVPNPNAEVPYTKTVSQALQEISVMEDVAKGKPLPPYYRELSTNFKTTVHRFAKHQHFFHWCVEFPEVFTDVSGKKGGFDVMCGNPPWDKIKVEDKKWFAAHGREDIVDAGTAAQRKALIMKLPAEDATLYGEYHEALDNAEAMSRFARLSGRYQLTAKGDIDLYPMFAELCLTFSKDAWGLVLPTAIATNDTNKEFFAKLIDENRLISLFDFENKEGLFDIHRMFKFCLLTAGAKQETPRQVRGGFYLTRIDHLLDPNRIYTLETSDFERLNPNTKTCPIFRTSRDAQLTAKIYRVSKIVYNENTNENPWSIRTNNIFHMSGDSDKFRTYRQMVESEATFDGRNFITKDGELYVPLYEGKMIWLYNFQYGTWPKEGKRPNAIASPSVEELSNTNNKILPWYWVPINAVKERLVKYDNEGNVIWKWNHNWLIGFRQVSNSQNERTFIICYYPSKVGAGDTIINVFPNIKVMESCLFVAMTSSIVFDYACRQKVGGSHVNNFLFRQFPVLKPSQITDNYQWQIVRRVAELCYFNHDLDGWAEELNEELTDEQRQQLPQIANKEPWIYNPDRRAVLQAELDAIFGHLYGLNTEDMRYILDPEDVCGKGCINETFRVLRDNEIRQFGEYRTKRLVMEAWKRFGYD